MTNNPKDKAMSGDSRFLDALNVLYEDGYNDGGVGVRQEKEECIEEAKQAIFQAIKANVPEEKNITSKRLSDIEKRVNFQHNRTRQDFLNSVAKTLGVSHDE